MCPGQEPGLLGAGPGLPPGPKSGLPRGRQLNEAHTHKQGSGDTWGRLAILAVSQLRAPEEHGDNSPPERVGGKNLPGPELLGGKGAPHLLFLKDQPARGAGAASLGAQLSILSPLPAFSPCGRPQGPLCPPAGPLPPHLPSPSPEVPVFGPSAR